MKNRLFHFTIMIVSLLSFSCSNKTYVENTNTTKLEINEGGFNYFKYII